MELTSARRQDADLADALLRILKSPLGKELRDRSGCLLQCLAQSGHSRALN
jgi:hypothetical protein